MPATFATQGEPRLVLFLRDDAGNGLAAIGDDQFFPGSLDVIQQLQALRLELRSADRPHLTRLDDQFPGTREICHTREFRISEREISGIVAAWIGLRTRRWAH